jgi:tetratricopeptide (TPR) repeat protein
MAQGNLDFAMRRYNQSWLLNPNNYQSYWGFGRVMIEQDKVDDSIRHLEKAKQLSINDKNKPPLLADLAAVYAIKGEITRDSEAGEKARYFALANESFKESVKLDPSYANAWRQWAMALFRQGDYASAWEKVKEARARNAKALPPAFIRDLQQKMPEPK